MANGFSRIPLVAPKVLLIDYHNTIVPTVNEMAAAFASTIVANNRAATKFRRALMQYYKHSVGTPLDEQFREGLQLVDGQEHSKAEGISLADFHWSEFLKLSLMPFEEIEVELARLKRAGWKIFLSTDNPQKVADALVDKVGFRKLFDGVLGRAPEETAHKVELHAKKAAELIGISWEDRGKHLVYFGDSKGEMQAARKIGIFAVGRATTKSARQLKLAGAHKVVSSKLQLAKQHIRRFFR